MAKCSRRCGFFMPEKKQDMHPIFPEDTLVILVRIQHAAICLLQRKILPTSTSNATRKNKKSNPKSQSLKPWRDLQCLTIFRSFEDLFQTPFLKNSHRAISPVAISVVPRFFALQRHQEPLAPRWLLL